MGKYDPHIIKGLQEALENAYPNVALLQQMVKYELDQNLNLIAEGKGLRESVFELIQWYESRDRLPELAGKATAHNATNVLLQETADTIRFLDEAARISGDADYSSFLPIVEDLKTYLSAEKYTPAFGLAFLFLIGEMNRELKNGVELRYVVDQIISGDFVKSSWGINELYQGQKNVFHALLLKFRDDSDPKRQRSEITVPVVLAVMTQEEALELNGDEYFISYSDGFQKEFEKLRGLFEAHNGTDWTENYGITSENWRPFGKEDQSETIRELIEKGLEQIAADGNPPSIVFFDIRELNSEGSRISLKELRQKGCIIVVDDLSICHKTINKAFYQSGLDVYPDTTMVRIAPVRSAVEILEELELTIRMKISEMEFFKRQKYDPGDFGSCAEVSNEYQFRDWLVTRTKKMHGLMPGRTNIKKYMFDGLNTGK